MIVQIWIIRHGARICHTGPDQLILSPNLPFANQSVEPLNRDLLDQKAHEPSRAGVRSWRPLYRLAIWTRSSYILCYIRMVTTLHKELTTMADELFSALSSVPSARCSAPPCMRSHFLEDSDPFQKRREWVWPQTPLGNWPQTTTKAIQ